MKKLFLIAFALVAANVWAQEIYIDGLTYKILTDPSGSNAGTVEVAAKSTAYAGAIVIPDQVTYSGNGKTYDVVSIASKAFIYTANTITSIEIGANVQRIGEYAFYNDKNTFTTITVADGNQYFTAEDGVLYNKDKTELIFFPPYNTATITDNTFTVPATVKVISAYAFQGAQSLRYITLPEGLTTLGKSAFSSTLLTQINLPASLRTIEGQALSTNWLSTITVDSNSQYFTAIDNIVYNKELTKLIHCPQRHTFPTDIPETVTELSNFSFVWNRQTDDIRVPSSIKVIGDTAFMRASFKTIVIPNSVTSIGKGAFFQADAKTVFVGDGVTSLPNDCFYMCSSLASIHLGKNISTIGAYALGSCTSLANITSYATTPPSISIPNVFPSAPAAGGKLYVPAASVDAYAAAEGWKKWSPEALSNSFEITDGEIFYKSEQAEYETLTYSREFTNTAWQAWYVPFDVPVSKLEENGMQVAEFISAHDYDNDNDGKSETHTLVFKRLKEGTLQGNRPALIKASNASATLALELSAGNLYPSDETSIELSATEYKFVFHGTYTGVSGTNMYNNHYYALGNGNLAQVASNSVSLKPQRWYMEIVELNPSNGSPDIRFNVIDVEEEGLNTGIADIETEKHSTQIFNINGARVTDKHRRGLYVQNGKKVMVR